MASNFVENLCLVGKSIPPNEPTECVRNVEISMGYCRRINQLYSTVCPHENQLKHEIANHYKDAKNRTFAHKIRKAKRTLASKIIQRIKKKPSTSMAAVTSSAVITASNAFKTMKRKREKSRRQFPLRHRNILQIPSITFPRYYCYRIDANKLLRVVFSVQCLVYRCSIVGDVRNCFRSR